MTVETNKSSVFDGTMRLMWHLVLDKLRSCYNSIDVLNYTLYILCILTHSVLLSVDRDTWMWYLSVPTNSEAHPGWMCWS